VERVGVLADAVDNECQRNDDGDSADGFADGGPFAGAEFLQPVVFSPWYSARGIPLA